MTVKATRHSKTPAQRAQETVDVLEQQVRDLTVELAAVTKRLDYAKASPDLPVKQPAKENTP